MIEVELGIRLISEANSRGHWAKRAKRFKGHKIAALAVPRHALPVLVTITRLGPGRMDDDNLAGAAKALRDGIAARLGVDDGDTRRIRFQYRQERANAHGVRVRLEPLVAPAALGPYHPANAAP